MPLDKLTLHAQLAMLAKNASALDAAIVEKTQTLQQLTIDLERTRGARHYHDMVAQQITAALAEAEREEKTAVTPPTVTS